MSFEARYQKLNEEQKLAVDTIDGPVMVVAGPGTGKTELLSLRVANILRQTDVLPSNILCLTFTDVGAANMRERLVGLIGMEAYKVAIHTFHSFALDVTNRFREDFYQARKMKPADEIMQIEMIGKILDRLPLNDALAQKDHTGDFVYLGSVKNRIGKLKKAGLTPKEYEQILIANAGIYNAIEALIVPVFEARMSKKTLTQVPELLQRLRTLNKPNLPLEHSSLLDYQEIIIRSLTLAYEQALEDDSTKPLTAWKEDWLKRDSDSGVLQLKDQHQFKRNLALAGVYADYQEQMLAAGYVDFDDMIIDLIQTLLKKPGMLAELQEQYQYILVDEFQDTNEAQMRIVNLLADNEINEGRPNVMVVGDDDQAIYKFQGAEINNVWQFKKQYPATRFIVLNKNYRSTAAIVDLTQLIIGQGQDRLSQRVAELEKSLVAANPNLAEGTISIHSLDTAAHEYAYVIEQIKAQLAAGVPAKQIAVIARNHRQLVAMAEQCRAAGVAIEYEKQNNVLEDKPIQELIILAQLVESLAQDNLDYKAELLPALLGCDFWQLDRAVVWQLAIEARQQKKTSGNGDWLEAMLKSNSSEFNQLAKWLLEMAAQARTQPLAQILDQLIGPAMTEEGVFSSPLRRFYFNAERYQTAPADYLQFLASLNSFISAVKNFASQKEQTRLGDLVRLVELYQKHDLQLVNNSPSLSGAEAIQLLSAHKAKGLEFETVFVINCQEDIWAKSQNSDMIAFPKNLPIDPAGDSLDDYLRLFFVALTRAKKHLFITSYTQKDNGKTASRLAFVEIAHSPDFGHHLVSGHLQVELGPAELALATSVLPTKLKVQPAERVLLQPLIDKYVMSVTHLNHFLDVTRGGPYSFLERDLLRFPQAKTANSAYGTAMHSTMEMIYGYLRQNGELPDRQTMEKIYFKELSSEQLSELDHQKYWDKGLEALRAYALVAKERMAADHWIETDFKTQQARVADVPITGKIDKIVPNEVEKTLEVYDFKTGRASQDWHGLTPSQKISLYNYKRQLTFYKLLVELSRDYQHYQVHQGHLEFLEPTRSGKLVVLSYGITEQDVTRLKALILAVDKKIRNLDLPDVSGYEQSLAGIMQFEDDLIEGRV